MGDTLAREIGLLRTLARNLEQTIQPLPPDYLAYVRANNLPIPSEEGIAKTTILPGGRQAFGELAECLVARSPRMERGTIHPNVLDELFKYLQTFIGRDATSIGTADAQSLVKHFDDWLESAAKPQRVFIPCVLTPWAAPQFRIGPVEFVFIDDIPRSGWTPGIGSDSLDRRSFDDVVAWMREARGNWLARVEVDGCERDRALEVAALAVDLAIVALHLAAPAFGTRDMCRLEARRGFDHKRSLVEQDGHFAGGWTRQEPGISIGAGTLADILRKTEPLIGAVGHVVQSFASGDFRRPNLERAWCDAAYWMHEALIGSIDSIAITKLETALEVLLRAESASGSKQRVLAVLWYFFDLKPDDFIREGSTVTARQFATNVVDERSRILHGTRSTLGARLSTSREGMERFVTTVIREAVIALDAYCQAPGTEDSIEAFLGWLSKRRSA